MTETRSPNLIQHSHGSLVWLTKPDPMFGADHGGVCYVAGPMTGRPGFNYPAFDGARDQLVSEGWSVINPADLDRINLDIDFSVMEGTEDLGKYGTAFARQDISSLLLVDAVFLLDDWQMSTGATNEAKIATMLGVQLFEFGDRSRVYVDARFSQAGG